MIGSQPAKKSKTFQPIQAPCFRLRPSRLLTDENANKIRALAGPRIYRKGKWENTIEAPDNCAWLVEQELQKLGMPYSLAQNAYYRPELTWTEVRANLLRKGEVKPEALDMIFDYQQDGVVFSANRGSAALWYPGGAGKTVTMLLALLQVCSAGPLPLVFVTKAAVRGQWASAITQFTNGIEPYVLRPLPDTGDVPEVAKALLAVPGLGAKKIVRLHVELGVCTIADLREALRLGTIAKLKGFGKKSAAAVESGLHRLRPVTETLDNYVQRMRSERRRPVVVVAWTALRDWWGPLSTLLGGIGGLGMDEIHTGKNAKRQRVKVTPEGEATYEDLGNLSSSASKLARSAKFRIAATATSIKDRLRDLWAQLDLIEPGAWGTFGTWARRYCAATEGQFGGLNTSGVAIEYLDELTDRLSFCVHRVPYEVSHAALVGLKRRESWRLGADELGEGWQPERLRTELKAAKLRGYSAELEVMVAAAASQIREPLVERIRDDIESTPNAKICILDIRHDNVDQLAAALTAGLECEVLCVHGGNTTPETRNKIREYYMNHPGPIVMVATGDSVGTGYDLHDTDVAYLSALPWDPGNLHQWEQRFFRHGMKRSCRLVYCIPVGSVIETIAARILSKMPAVERVTKDMETSSASAVLGGTDDKEKLAREILAVLDSIDGDLLEDD